MDQIIKNGIYRLAEELRTGRISSAELTKHCLDTIDGSDGEIGAFICTDGEAAMRAAAAADEVLAAARRDGSAGSLSPLCGIPAALKDNICTENFPTTCASRMLEGYRPPYSATAAERLEAAGCVILGKTNMDEFAMGNSTETSAWKITKNPLDTRRSPGGSSGGSAAAVAAGMCCFAIGTDTGGSVRIPAAMCGTVGFRPTYGAIPRRGMIPLASSMDTVGILGMSAADCAAVFAAVSGRSAGDATSRTVLRDAAKFSKRFGGAADTEVLKGLKIAVLRDDMEKASPEVAAAVSAQLEKTAASGAEIEYISVPSLKYAAAAYGVICAAEASSDLARFDGVRFGRRGTGEFASCGELCAASRGEGFGAEVRRRITFGVMCLGEGRSEFYDRAAEMRRRICADLDAVFEKYDMIAGPASPDTAPLLASAAGGEACRGDTVTNADTDGVTSCACGEAGIFRDTRDSMISTAETLSFSSDAFCIPASLAGLASVSIPCPHRGGGMPAGLLMTSAAGRDAMLLETAAACGEG